MNQEAAMDYTLLPKEEYDLKFKKLSRDDPDSYSVNIIQKIIPEKVVRDFGIEKIINRLLPLLVAEINDYSDEQRMDSAVGLAYWIISNESGELLESGKEKYSKIINFEFVPERLSRYVLEYVVNEANKAKFPLKITMKDVRGFWKAGVQNA